MNTGRKRSALSYVPGLSSNAVLQLILFVAGAYIALAITWAIMMIVYGNDGNFITYFVPAIGLPDAAHIKDHWWTPLIYGIFHKPNSFMEMASNMLWLYCFGSVVQMLVGYKQIIPLFFYSLVAGGVFYLAGRSLPGALGAMANGVYLMGPRAGLVAMAAAAVTLTPKYRFWLTDTFSIPLLAVAGIFAVLMILNSGFWLPVILLMVGGGIAGWAYVKLLKAGYRPGAWMYSLSESAERAFTPNEAAIAARRKTTQVKPDEEGITQSRIDAILDKINQKGYNSLTREEREVLMRVGKDEQKKK